MRRANNPDDKALRYRQILDCARTLHRDFQRLPTAAEMAGHLGLGKGTLYLYFRSREAIFLTLLEDDMRSWLERLETAVDTLPLPQAIDDLCRHIAGDEDSCRLAALAHGLIEHCDDLDAIQTFKRHMADAVARCAARVAKAAAMEERSIQALIQASHAMVVGLWQAANPPAAIRALPDATGLLVPNFSNTVRQALFALWQGWLTKHRH
ncbi:hypothetical protein [Gallaecimonas pentaromativorans]|uniref:hypothetical protein n=1 Tax=Gallaecimonas pentaromativorans TaxID=584787 RepID=UPI003A958086